jgi:hypothetical protein
MAASVRSFRHLLIFGCILLAAGCSGGARKRAERELHNGGAERLRDDAARLYKDTFAAHGKPGFVEVPYKTWPPSFQKLRPLHVGAYLDGISIALEAEEGGESGFYIVPKSMEHEPSGEHGAKYERLADGIYWYSFEGRKSGAVLPP